MLSATLRRVKRWLRDPDAQVCAPGEPLPVRDIETLFPGISQVDVQVPFGELHHRHFYALPLTELFVLGALCRYLRPRRVFEIGTYTGSTTLVMAANAAPGSEILTLDLEDARLAQVASRSVGGEAQFRVGAAFEASPHRTSITQLRGDSASFDFDRWRGAVDLVFIDGDHRYQAVAHDSACALELLSPAGIIVWDDYVYRVRFPECAGVSRWLHEAGPPATYRLADTRFALHRRADHS